MKPVEIEFLMKDYLSGGLDKAGKSVDNLAARAQAAADAINMKIAEQHKVIDGVAADLDRMERQLAGMKPGTAQRELADDVATCRRTLVEERGALQELEAQHRQAEKAVEALAKGHANLSASGEKAATSQLNLAEKIAESKNLIKGTQADIKELEKAYNNAAPGNAKGAALEELNAAKKALEEEKAILASLTAEQDRNNESNKRLSMQLRELQDAMAKMRLEGRQDSEEYRQMAAEAATLSDTIADLRTQTKILSNDDANLQGFMSGLSGIAGMFTTATGAMSLFASENEDLVKIQTRVQSVMAITMGMQQVLNTLNKDSAFRLVTLNGLKAWWNKLLIAGTGAQAAETTATTAATAAQVANTGAAVAGTAANIGLAGAFRMVGAAIASIPVFGWIAAAIGGIIAVVSHFIDKANEADKELEEHEKLLEDGRKAYAKASVEISDYTNKIKDFNGTKKQEKQLVEELNGKYGSAMGYYSSLSQWKDVLKKKGEAYCNMLLKEAEAQAILNKYTEAFVNLQEVKDKAKAGEYDHWYNTKAGDEKSRAKAIAEAKAEQDKWLDLYKQKMNEAQTIRTGFDLNPHIDPKSSATKDTGKGGDTFDPKAAAREYKKIYDAYVADITKFIKDANARISEQQIEASGDGLIRELNGIRYSTYQKEQAWKEQLKQLAEIRKNAVKEQYMTQEGHNEDTWEKTAESKKTNADYQKELLFNSDGTQTGLAKKYYEVLNGITEQGEAKIAETRQKYYDGWVREYGTTEQKLDALTAKYTTILNSVPEKFRQGVMDAWDEEESQIKLTELKKEMNWEEIFGNLDHVATSSLQSLKAKLQDYLKKNKDLAPEGLKEIVSSIDKIDDKLAERDPFDTLHKSLKTLSTANKDVKDAQDAYNKAVKEGTKAEQENAKATLEAAKNAKQKALGEATDALHSAVGKVKEYVGVAEDLMGLVGNLGIKPPEWMEGFLDGAGQMLDGLESIDLTKPMSIVSGGIKTLSGAVKSLTSLGGVINWNGSNAKEVQDTINRLTDRNEKLQTSIEDLTDEIKSSKGTKSVAAYRDAYKYQQETIANYLEMAMAQAGYHNAHKSWNHYWGGFSQSQIDKLSKQMGRAWGGDIWDLSPEEMKMLRSNVDMWTQIQNSGKGGYGSRLTEILDEYIDQAGKLQELTDQLYEGLTGVSFDGMYSSFIDNLMDMKYDAKAAAEDVSEYFYRAMLSNKIGEMYSDKLKEWWEKFGKAMEDNDLTEAERSALADEYMQYVNEAINLRDSLAAATGYTPSDSDSGKTQSGKAGGFAAMSQDQGTKLEGMFTSGLRHWSSMDERLEDVAGKMNQAEGHLARIAENTGKSAGHLEEIAENMVKIIRDGVKVK